MQSKKSQTNNAKQKDSLAERTTASYFAIPEPRKGDEFSLKEEMITSKQHR